MRTLGTITLIGHAAGAVAADDSRGKRGGRWGERFSRGALWGGSGPGWWKIVVGEYPVSECWANRVFVYR
jgi:hypothetical protein